MNDPYRPVRCPACGRLLCESRGAGAEIRIRCKCHRFVVIRDGTPAVEP